MDSGPPSHSRWRSWCTKRCSVGPFRLFGLGCDNALSPRRHFVGGVQDEDVFVPRVAARWGEMFQSEPLPGKAACSQRSCDAVAIMGKPRWTLTK